MSNTSAHYPRSRWSIWRRRSIEEENMTLNYLAIAVAAVAAVVLSTAYYSAFSSQLAALHDAYASAGANRPPAWKVLVELARSLVVAAVLAGLADSIGIDGWGGAAVPGGLGRFPGRALDRRGHLGERASEARRNPCRRLADQAAGRRLDCGRLALTTPLVGLSHTGVSRPACRRARGCPFSRYI